MATIQDIAERANVSKATVSRVINNTSTVAKGTRDAVEAAMTDLQFQPNMMARSLAGGRSMTIGIVTQNIGTPFYDTIAQGVISGLAKTGYSPIFVDGEWQNSRANKVIEALLGRNVDGLVLIGGETPVAELVQLQQRLPMVIVGRELPDWDGKCIHVNNEAAGFEAAQHLLRLGHQKIAFIHGIADHPDAVSRFNGYRRALANAGLPFDDALVFRGDFGPQCGVMAVTSLLSQGIHFTALLAANDMVAFGARLALHRNGIRVPEDVSIVGFDDQAESAFMTPPLTTMRQPATEMGELAAASLMEALGVDVSKSNAIKQEDLAIKLVMRESVARVT